ncbi:MAG: hypothetical protein WAX69_03280 [Victivallales bacterium]
MNENELLVGAGTQPGCPCPAASHMESEVQHSNIYRFDPDRRFLPGRLAQELFLKMYPCPPRPDIKTAIGKLRLDSIYKDAKAILIVVDSSDSKQLYEAAIADGKKVFRVTRQNWHLFFPNREEEEAIELEPLDMVICSSNAWTSGGAIHASRSWKRRLFKNLDAQGFIKGRTSLVAFAYQSQCYSRIDPLKQAFIADIILSPEKGVEFIFDERTRFPRFAVRIIEGLGGTIDENGIPCHLVYGGGMAVGNNNRQNKKDDK